MSTIMNYISYFKITYLNKFVVKETKQNNFIHNFP